MRAWGKSKDKAKAKSPREAAKDAKAREEELRKGTAKAREGEEMERLSAR